MDNSHMPIAFIAVLGQYPAACSAYKLEAPLLAAGLLTRNRHKNTSLDNSGEVFYAFDSRLSFLEASISALISSSDISDKPFFSEASPISAIARYPRSAL